MTARPELIESIEILQHMDRRGDEFGLRRFDLSVAQVEWLAIEGHKVFRASTQTAHKTTALFGELNARCTRVPPPGIERDYPPGPITVILVTASETQGVEIQEKYLDTADRREFAQDYHATFHDKWGLGQGRKVIRYKDGSRVIFFTAEMDREKLASITADVSAIDEPITDSGKFQEVCDRVKQTGGDILQAFTPTKPAPHLEAFCLRDDVTDYHVQFTAESMKIWGRDSPMRLKSGKLKDADYVANMIKATPESEAWTTLHGNWPRVGGGTVFTAYDARVGGAHVRYLTPQEIVAPHTWHLGIDHGTGASMSQVAILVRSMLLPDNTVLHYVWNEYVTKSDTSSAEDAEAIVRLLAGAGIKWGDLSSVYGDRKHSGHHDGESKDNEDLREALEELLGFELEPEIITAKTKKALRGAKPRGSVERGVQQIQRFLVDATIGINPEAAGLRKHLERYTGKHNDKYGHAIDALRYTLNDVIHPPRSGVPWMAV